MIIMATSLENLFTARNKLAKAYETEVNDDLHDNGNLEKIHEAIKIVEDAIQIIQNRNGG